MLYQPAIKKFNPEPPVNEFMKRTLRQASRIIIRTSNWLGDALMTLPATYKIRELMSADAELAVLTPKGLSAIWEASPWIDTVFSMPQKRVDSETRRAIREYSADIGIIFPNSFGSAWDLWQCRIPVLFGRRGNLRRWMLDASIPSWKHLPGYSDRHQLSFYLELVSALGPIEWNCECPSLEIQPEFSHGIKKGAGWLGIAPGAAFGPAKQWSPESFAAVANAWLTNHSGKIVLVGTQKERNAAETITALLPSDRVLDLAGKTSMKELMAVLGSVDYLIANDSGAMHLAAALGTDGSAVFGSTDPVATGPIGAAWRIFTTDAPCAPCFQRTCPLPPDKAYRCLHAIFPEDVIASMP